jgi:F0F1-type ATP synthase membrane subunit a
VLSHALACLYTRSLYGVAHVYIGYGQHVLLRIALGVIETLSGCFRSVSLSLRVVCNAAAGHVLLAVLVEMSCSASGH